MRLSTSFLSIKDNLIDNIKKIDNTTTDLIHIDVMDGIFVSNKSWNFDFYQTLLKDTQKPKDVHLMVSNIKQYIDTFKELNPYYITFHYEATLDILNIVKYIHSLGIRAGLSIKPSTSVEEILEFLPYIDLVLVMSVEPGKGGQAFIDSSVEKINQLRKIKEEYDYAYQIEVDGGINDETSKLCSNADILVVGSYITSAEDYQKQIDNISLN